MCAGEGGPARERPASAADPSADTIGRQVRRLTRNDQACVEKRRTLARNGMLMDPSTGGDGGAVEEGLTHGLACHSN